MIIERISANKETFRDVVLQPGFNIIVADRTKESTRTDSRNGLGKSTLIEIIHFILGSNLSREQNLDGLRGTDWEFTAWFDLDGTKFSATRSLDDTSRVKLSGQVEGLGIELEVKQGSSIARLSGWKSFLGKAYFRLDDGGLSESSYKPSFRALVSYFVRPGRGAYLSPFEVRSKQVRWQTQVYNAYLLGLNWRLATEWQRLRDVERTLKAVGKNAQEGLERFVGQVGELESERVRLLARVNDLRTQSNNFRVVPEYEAVENRVNSLTFEMQNLAAENAFESRLILRYEADVEAEERAVSRLDIDHLLADVGVIIPQSIVRSLDEVAEFHAKVTENRQVYLDNEVDRLRVIVAERRARLAQLEAERQEALSLLETGGALEDFTRMQMRLAEASADLEVVERRLEEARKLRTDKAQVDAEKKALQVRAIVDHDERRPVWSSAIESFARYSEYLYGTPGALVIEVDETGYDFRTRIEGGGSHGRDNMAIFCYDLTLAQLWCQESTILMVHDSELYDPVDERQKALALKLAAAESKLRGYQYLATLNSDQIPLDDLRQIDFDVESFIRLRLTDANPSGSLLGFRF